MREGRARGERRTGRGREKDEEKGKCTTGIRGEKLVRGGWLLKGGRKRGSAKDEGVCGGVCGGSGGGWGKRANDFVTKSGIRLNG